MADNVTFQTTTATPPSGTVVSTEEVSTLNGSAVAAQQVQRVIPAIRTGDGTAVDIPGDSSNGIDVDVTRVSGTVAISAASLPLPSGAATSANQSSELTLIGAVDEIAPATDTASSGLNGRLQRIAQRLTSLIALLPTSLGQKAKAASLAVTLASDQDALPVTDNGSTLSVDDGGSSLTVDNAALSVTGGGVEASALRVTLANDSTGVLSVDDNGASLTVDGTVAATQSGTWTLGANSGVDIGDVTINNASGGSAVNIQDGGNSITVDGAVTASNTAGDVAHDSSDSGNPVKVGGKAYNFDGTAPGTAVAEGDRAQVITDVYGRPFVETAHPTRWSVNENHTTAQTNNELKATPGAGLRLYITDIILSTDTAMNIKLVEDTGGTPVTIAGPYYFAANGGMHTNFRNPIPVTADKNLGFTSSAAGNHAVTINGYTAP